MTSIKNFFESTTSLTTTPSPVKSEMKHGNKTDHKQIVSNMKSVINSVKLHKKTKKKKRLLDQPQEIHDISNILKSNLSFISPNAGNDEQCESEILKDLSVNESSESLAIIDLVRTEESRKENNSVDGKTTTFSSKSACDGKNSKLRTNAFEVMMTARNKSIGTNSPGKEIPNKEVSTLNTEREVHVKRRLMLEEWAERKNGHKNRLNEAANDDYIDMVMKKRSRRLRTLLLNGKKATASDSSDVKIKHTPTKISSENILKMRKRRIVDSDDDDNCYDIRKASSIPVNAKTTRKTSSDGNFCDKLSSPLKKRDSLFRYFDKSTKSRSDDLQLTITEQFSENKSKRRKRRLRGQSPVDEKLDKSINIQHEITPSASSITSSETSSQLAEGRPKRLCREKKKSYFIEEDYTPPKGSKSKPSRLAPIFGKAVPKPIIDPIVLRARHEFLMSGIPEKMKLEIEKQRRYEECLDSEYEVFPKISHIGRHIESVGMDFTKFNIRFRRESSEDLESLWKVSFKDYKLKTETQSISRLSNKAPISINQKRLIRQLKQLDASQFPYYRCFKQLKRRLTIHLPTEEHDDCSIELVVDDMESVNGNLMFTDKFKPMMTNEILMNIKPLTELRKFLSSWQEENEQECFDSGDDFNTNSSNTYSSLNKAVVLTGPPGCGKTMCVYALANEMNFKVLEINAGTKRTGKKVLQKLQEATQSHHVSNNQFNQNDRLSFVKSTKSKSSQSDDSEDCGGTQKLSLILIEDAEIVFEQDFGFIESINQLITTTKRPVILVTNQINCAHLSRLISRNAIAFKPPQKTATTKWLSTLSVVEHCYVTEDECLTQYQQNNCDFRKTLLELQFFIQSTNITSENEDTNVTCNEGMFCDLFFKDQNRSDMIVPFPVDFTKLIYITTSILNPTDTEVKCEKIAGESSHLLSDSSKLLDMASTAIWVDRRTDCRDRLTNHLSEEISHFMVEQILKIQGFDENSYSKLTGGTPSINRPRQLASTISSPYHHSMRAIELDIEPYLRSICRSELKRSQLERRSSRFYHYLRNANTETFGVKVFDDHCSIFSNER